MSQRYFLQSSSPPRCWPQSAWPRFRVFPPRHARWPAIQLVNYLLTPLQLIPIHARIGAGNTFTRQSTPCRSLATPSVYAPAVALVRYHSLEPAQRHLTPRPGGTPRW